MTSTSERHASHGQPKMACLVLGLFLALTGAAAAQTATSAVKCARTGDYLLTVTNPPPADRQLIMDLIHRYNWALDEGTFIGMKDMLLDDVTYQLCNAARDQLQKTTNREDLEAYLDAIKKGSDRTEFRTRHIESNTLLNAVDKDTVQGKTTLLVTVQFAAVEMPVVDYTGTLQTTFKRVDDIWKFSMLRLTLDGAEVMLRAR